MKKNIIAICVGVCLINVCSQIVLSEEVPQSAKHIVINEIYYSITGMEDKCSFVELYNPTAKSVNLMDLYFHPISFDGIGSISPYPLNETCAIIKPDKYVIFTSDIEVMKNDWVIGQSVNIFQLDLRYLGRFIVDNTDWTGHIDVFDGDDYPPMNYSWARYEYGYDTDNVTDDFYADANPTPGRTNNEIRTSKPDFNGDSLLVIIGVAVSVTVTGAGIAIYFMRKRRKKDAV
ncbi:MAG: hypothetical protein V1934_08305 [Methanobacteriota archaeon]